MAHLDPVLVGVDGSPASSAAIRFAALEAYRLDTDVHLVHVIPNYVPVTPLKPLVPLDLEETGRNIISAAQVEAHRILPLDRVRTSLLRGSRVLTLLDASEHARFVVLGAEQHAVIERVLTGSTVLGVAAGATCPVVGVPSDWTSHDVHRCVAAGVKSVQNSHELLRRAFEVAADRGARVLLVHAWELPGEYDDLVTARVDEDEWSDRVVRVIEDGLTDLRAAYPRVPVEIRVVHGQPARVLQTASGEADLLLVARRHRGFPFGHLGGTGRALLRVGHCPVEVVPPADEPTDTSGLVLEDAGRLRK